MTTRTLSQASLDSLSLLPPAKRGPGFRTVSVFSYSSGSSSNESIEVPDDLNSLEFLLFAGFDDTVARDIWRAWEQPGDRPHWVINDARYYIKQKAREHNAVDENDDWDSALRGMGLSTDLRGRILDPAFDYVRLTQSASYWALDSVNEAYEFLASLEKRMGKKRAELSRTDSPHESKKPRPASRGRGQHRYIGSSSSERESSTPVVQTTVPPKQIDGRTFFFKGGAEARLERCIAEDGTIKLGALHSEAPTDFHPEKATYLYLTKHHDVALIYARYVENRVPPVKGAVLQMAVSRELITSPREIYGEHWRDLIWNSRNTTVHESTYNKQLPAHLKTYEEADILVGQRCKNPTEKIADMTDKSELAIMKLPNGARASQFVIQSIPVQINVARDVRGFVWVVPTQDDAKD